MEPARLQVRRGRVDAEPDYSEAELDAIGEGSELSLNHLLPMLEIYDIDDETTTSCYIVIFDGRHDYSVSRELSAKWFARVHAPYKRLVSFEESAHVDVQEQPGRFLEHLLTNVRPFAVRVGDAAPDEEVDEEEKPRRPAAPRRSKGGIDQVRPSQRAVAIRRTCSSRGCRESRRG